MRVASPNLQHRNVALVQLRILEAYEMRHEHTFGGAFYEDRGICKEKIALLRLEVRRHKSLRVVSCRPLCRIPRTG